MIYQKDLVGIDIGSSSIKVVGLKSKLGNYHVMHTPRIASIPRGLVQQGSIEDIDGLIEHVKKIMKEGKFLSKIKRCALSLGGNVVIVKRIEVDVVRDQQIDMGEQIREIAEQTFANFDDLYWSYYALPSSVSTSRPVILCAAKIDEVERYISLMRRVGMKVGVTDASVLSLLNTFKYNYTNLAGFHLLIDTGATHATVVCLLNGEYCFSRDSSIGGDYYTSAISKELSVDMNRAEALKLSVSEGGVTAELSRALESVHQAFLQDVAQCIEYFDKKFSMKYGSQILKSIFLLGGGSLVHGLGDALANQFRVKVHFLNPFDRTKLHLSKSRCQELQAYSPFYGVSFGLGIRRVNM